MWSNAGGEAAGIPELQQGKKLLNVVEHWLREDKERQQQEDVRDPSAKLRRPGAVAQTNPIMPSKHMAFFR